MVGIILTNKDFIALYINGPFYKMVDPDHQKWAMTMVSKEIPVLIQNSRFLLCCLCPGAALPTNELRPANCIFV